MQPKIKINKLKKKKKDTRELSLHAHTSRKGHVRTHEKAAVHKPEGELSPETKSAKTLILDFQPSEL